MSGAARGRGIALALAIGLLALSVRAFRLEGPGLSSDEAFSWRLTRYGSAEIVRRTAADVHPPLYYLALAPWAGAFGTSPVALRSLSVLLSLLSLGAVFLLVREHERGRAEGGEPRVTAPLLALLLMALHETQVSPGRNARMYQLGILLAALSAWLLLRSLRSRGPLPWVGYGAAVAAFGLTHYYAVFTALAQGLWALAQAARRYREARRREAAATLRGLLLAAAVAALLVAGWLPVFRAQAREVWRGYWIAEVSGSGVVSALAEWSVGPADLHRPGAWVAAAAVLTAWLLARGGPPSGFFLVQAGLPWALGLALSLGGRSVFLARYMVFAHVALIGLWATAAARVPGRRQRLALCGLVLAVAVFGTFRGLARLPAEPPAEALAARHLARRGEPGDIVLVDSAYRLNRLLYYAERAGVRGLLFRCVLPRDAVGHGHVPHLSSLEPGDVVWLDTVPSLPGRRFWWGSITGHPWRDAPEGWTPVTVRTLSGGGGTRYTLTRYRRED